MLKNLFKKQAGKKAKLQSLVEYGLILALVSVVAITVLQLMGGKIKETVVKVNTKLDQANQMSDDGSTTP
ncbi:MAG: Flp family type IVb pilin [Desulfobacterales bacterium]|nr:Flp family type IVb pilin [Desulfobacterales bacterium]